MGCYIVNVVSHHFSNPTYIETVSIFKFAYCNHNEMFAHEFTVGSVMENVQK